MENQEFWLSLKHFITEDDLEILLMRFIDEASLRTISRCFKLAGRPEAEARINSILVKLQEFGTIYQ